MAAVELGAALATPALAPQLLQVARDPVRRSWERVAALRGLRRLGIAIPAEDLCRMLEDAVANWLEGEDEVFELLRFADSLDDTMLAVLDGCSARRRYTLLGHCEAAEATGTLPLAVYHALWRRWALDVGFASGEPVITYHREPEPLAGDPAALRDEFGVARLLQLVHEAIAGASLHLRCPLFERVNPSRYDGACAVLRELPEARCELARLLGSVALAPPVHADLAELALEIDRAATLAHVARFPSIWRRVARAVAESPRPEDRAFAEAAARSDDPEAAYWASAVIDQLGEPLGPLPVAELPRVRALWARARRGDRSAVAALVDATSAADVVVRADAMRWLGRLDDARDHLAIFERGLADEEVCDGRRPVVEQAALALHRAAGACTALLHAYFATGGAAVILDLLCGHTGAAASARRWSPFSREDWRWSAIWYE